MRQILYCVLIFSLFLSCEPENNDPIYSSDYGKGIYVLTEEGVVYYDYNSPDTLKVLRENIFQTVNAHSISSPASLKIINDDIYIVSKNTLYKVDANTFLKEMEIHGFVDARKCENARYNRLYVSDAGVAEIKVVDLDGSYITANIESGINVYPNSITYNSSRSFIVNSGGESPSDYDSTMVAVDIRDGVVPVNNFAGNVVVGKNPISILNDGAIIVLCKGVYDQNNPANNSESSIYRVGAGDLSVINVITLNNIYNANLIIFNHNKTKYYLTSSNGIYSVDASSYNYNLVTNQKTPSSFCVHIEQYADTDTTFAYSEMLYMNDENDNSENRFIYKYNVQLDSFVDSFPINSKVLDIQIYK